MRSALWKVAGMAVVLAGWLAWSHAQQEAAYRGSKACALCHRVSHAEIVAAHRKSPHAHALAEASAETVVADFQAAPFPRERAKYVLGSGRRYQAYMDANWKVLPGKWSVREKKWLPQEEVDGRSQCVPCHVTGLDTKTLEWKEMNVGCEACHGPGSLHLLDTKTGILVLGPLAKKDPHRAAMVCGQCHSRGHDPSGKFPFPVGYRPGEDLGKFFVDAQPQEAGMNQQFSDLIRSPKHWKNGVVCMTCHEAHGNTDQPIMLRKPINELCLECHKATVRDIPSHAQEKGVKASPGDTCATCHMPEGRHLFDKSIVPGK